MLSVFFFSSRRRHTRYWRDWSSDVCSSDLERAVGGGQRGLDPLAEVAADARRELRAAGRRASAEDWLAGLDAGLRSEERRVGKECRCWGAAEHERQRRGARSERGRLAHGER